VQNAKTMEAYVQELKHICETWHIQEVFVTHLDHEKTIDDGKLLAQFLAKGDADCLEFWFRHAPDDDANREIILTKSYLL